MFGRPFEVAVVFEFLLPLNRVESQAIEKSCPITKSRWDCMYELLVSCRYAAGEVDLPSSLAVNYVFFVGFVHAVAWAGGLRVRLRCFDGV